MTATSAGYAGRFPADRRSRRVRAALAACAWGLLPLVARASPPNPYAVSGADWSANGTMVRLGMPPDCFGYIWDQLIVSNVPNMVRPCKYWLLVGGGHRAHGYHEDTDTIDNPTVFGQWVLGHPGRIWIIGNEPNASSQDGLTPDQYARMFKTYYDFIRPRDPTARFAVAGLAYMADAASLAAQISWWDQALASYRTQSGAPMPIDIWNCHAYVAIGSLDPDRMIRDFLDPFRRYTRTVEAGLYADSELWITEFGVPSWSTPLDPVYINEFIEQLCPRLETRVERFFWFLGPWPGNWDATMTDLALIGPTGQPTRIGRTYGDLARSYPNPLPPPAPSQLPFPPPPALVTADFAADAGPWRVLSGDWALDGGGCRQTSLVKGCGAALHLPYEYRNVRVDCDVKINATAGNNPANWAGVSLRGGWIWDDGDLWTYLVYLRRNGDLGVYTRADGTVATVTGAVADTSVYHHIRVEVVGDHLHVYVDGVSRIEWDDPHRRRSSGVISLRVCKADATYDNVEVLAFARGDVEPDGDVDLDDFKILQACFAGANRPYRWPECELIDLDADGDIDLADFTSFQTCFNGPNRIPACQQEGPSAED